MWYFSAKLKHTYPFKRQNKIQCLTWDQTPLDVPVKTKLKWIKSVKHKHITSRLCWKVKPVPAGTPVTCMWQTQTEATPRRKHLSGNCLHLLRLQAEKLQTVILSYRNTVLGAILLEHHQKLWSATGEKWVFLAVQIVLANQIRILHIKNQRGILIR